MSGFDSRQYEWADVSVSIGGKDIVTIRAVKWDRETEYEELYGKGRDAISIQRGNNKNSGEFELLQSDFDAIEKAAGGDILKAVVDCQVAFGDPEQGDAIITHRALGCRFPKDSYELKQGDKFAAIKLPWIARKIQKNV